MNEVPVETRGHPVPWRRSYRCLGAPDVSAGKGLQVSVTLATTEHLSLTSFRHTSKESTTKASKMRHILSFL